MRHNILFLLLFSLALLSCSDREAEKVQQKATPNVAGGDVVLATVNGSVISRLDLEFATNKMIGEEAAARMDDEATRKVLESMVLSRAIAQRREKEMSDEERARLAADVGAYREQILVRQYLIAHGSPQPVSMEMIQEYYAAHPELFGGKTVKRYEMITSKRQLTVGERDELLARLANLQQEQDWRQLVDALAAQGYPLVYSQGEGDADLLHPNLAGMVQKLGQGQVSGVVFLAEKPYVLRVTGIQRSGQQPLAEVADRISKILSPAQMKKMLEEIGGKVLAESEVVYR